MIITEKREILTQRTQKKSAVFLSHLENQAEEAEVENGFEEFTPTTRKSRSRERPCEQREERLLSSKTEVRHFLEIHLGRHSLAKLGRHIRNSHVRSYIIR